MRKTPFIHYFIFLAFLANTLGPLPTARADEFRLPAPGTMVHLSTAFNPPVLKGIKVHPDDPFKFEFILDQGDSFPNPGDLQQESSKLIKYFLASLTIPEKDLWVNLSPFEKDRVIPQGFGLTEMGRDLLAEDYILKQITSSLIYPEDEIGKKFWKKVYGVAIKKYGTTDIPVSTFNKVWIVPDKAVVYENAKAGTAYVVESKLKVMLEQDYLALSHNVLPGHETSSMGANVIREIVIPELTREVNENKNFARLRQVYNSVILASWYKKKIKDSILARVYTDQNKVAGVNNDDPKEKERIYQQYLQAFKKGAFNYIKEDLDPLTQEAVPRKYFSGGVGLTALDLDVAMTTTPIEPIENSEKLKEVSADFAIAGPSNSSFVPNQDLAMSARYIQGLNDPAHNHFVDKAGETFTIQAKPFKPGSNYITVALQGPKAGSPLDDGNYPNVMSVAVYDGEVHPSIYLDNRYKWTDGTPMGRDLGGGNGVGTSLLKSLARLMTEGTMLKGKVENQATRQLILGVSSNPIMNGEAMYYRDQTTGQRKKIVDGISHGSDEMTVEQLISETVIGKIYVRSGLVNLRFRYKDLEGTSALRSFLNDQRSSKNDVFFIIEAMKPKAPINNKPLQEDQQMFKDALAWEASAKHLLSHDIQDPVKLRNFRIVAISEGKPLENYSYQRVLYQPDHPSLGYLVVTGTGEVSFLVLDKGEKGTVASFGHNSCFSVSIRAKAGQKDVIGHAHINPDISPYEPGRQDAYEKFLMVLDYLKRQTDWQDIQIGFSESEDMHGFPAGKTLKDLETEVGNMGFRVLPSESRPYQTFEWLDTITTPEGTINRWGPEGGPYQYKTRPWGAQKPALSGPRGEEDRSFQDLGKSLQGRSGLGFLTPDILRYSSAHTFLEGPAEVYWKSGGSIKVRRVGIDPKRGSAELYTEGENTPRIVALDSIEYLDSSIDQDNINTLIKNLSVYTLSNEQNQDSIDSISSSFHGDVYMGFSGWFNYQLMFKRNVKYAFLLDKNLPVVLLHRMTAEVIRRSRDRFEFVKNFEAALQSSTRLGLEGDWSELKFMTQIKGSWLGSDENFSFIKRMYEDNRIISSMADIRLNSVFARIARWLKENNFMMDAVYSSNILAWVIKDRNGPQEYYDSLSTVSSPSTIIIDSERQQRVGSFPLIQRARLASAVPGLHPENQDLAMSAKELLKGFITPDQKPLVPISSDKAQNPELFADSVVQKLDGVILNRLEPSLTKLSVSKRRFEGDPMGPPEVEIRFGPKNLDYMTIVMGENSISHVGLFAPGFGSLLYTAVGAILPTGINAEGDIVEPETRKKLQENYEPRGTDVYEKGTNGRRVIDGPSDENNVSMRDVVAETLLGKLNIKYMGLTYVDFDYETYHGAKALWSFLSKENNEDAFTLHFVKDEAMKASRSEIADLEKRFLEIQNKISADDFEKEYADYIRAENAAALLEIKRQMSREDYRQWLLRAKAFIKKYKGTADQNGSFLDNYYIATYLTLKDPSKEANTVVFSPTVGFQGNGLKPQQLTLKILSTKDLQLLNEWEKFSLDKPTTVAIEYARRKNPYDFVIGMVSEDADGKHLEGIMDVSDAGQALAGQYVAIAPWNRRETGARKLTGVGTVLLTGCMQESFYRGYKGRMFSEVINEEDVRSMYSVMGAKLVFKEQGLEDTYGVFALNALEAIKKQNSLKGNSIVKNQLSSDRAQLGEDRAMGATALKRTPMGQYITILSNPDQELVVMVNRNLDYLEAHRTIAIRLIMNDTFKVVHAILADMDDPHGQFNGSQRIIFQSPLLVQDVNDGASARFISPVQQWLNALNVKGSIGPLSFWDKMMISIYKLRYRQLSKLPKKKWIGGFVLDISTPLKRYLLRAKADVYTGEIEASNSGTASPAAGQNETGGIDLTPERMNLQTQNAGAGIRFNMDPARLKELQNAPGFVPVIVNIQPMRDLKAFLDSH